MCFCTKSVQHGYRLWHVQGRLLETLKRLQFENQLTNAFMYAIIAQKLSSQDFGAIKVPEHCDSEEGTGSSVDLLSTPFLGAVYCTTYGLVSRVRTGGSSAFTCSHKGCDHVATLKEWYALNGLNEEISDIWSSVGSRGQKLHSYVIPDDPIIMSYVIHYKNANNSRVT